MNSLLRCICKSKKSWGKSLLIAIVICFIIYLFDKKSSLTSFIEQYYVAIAIALFSTLIASLAILVPWLFTYYKLLIKVIKNKQISLPDLCKSSSCDLVEFFVWLAISFITYVVWFSSKTEDASFIVLVSMMFFIIAMIAIIKGCVNVMITLVKFLLCDVEKINFK